MGRSPWCGLRSRFTGRSPTSRRAPRISGRSWKSGRGRTRTSRSNPWVWGGDANAFYAKLAAEAASGRAPDAVQMPDLPIYNQWLQPIDQYIRDQLDDFFPWTHEIMIDPAGRQDQAHQVQHRDRRPLVPARSGAGAAAFLRRADCSRQEVAGGRNGESDRSGQRADLPPDFPDVVFSGQVLVRRQRATDLRQYSGRPAGHDRHLRRLPKTHR